MNPAMRKSLTRGKSDHGFPVCWHAGCWSYRSRAGPRTSMRLRTSLPTNGEPSPQLPVRTVERSMVAVQACHGIRRPAICPNSSSI